MRVRVKICGITNARDARAAVRHGADALGFVFAESPRKVTPERARAIIENLPPFVTPVALFVNEDPKQIVKICEFCGINTVQLHGDERPSDVKVLNAVPGLKVIKAIRVMQRSDINSAALYTCDAYLLDAFVPGVRGGTGRTFRWEWAADAKQFGPVIIAGGLKPDNVGEAVKLVRPFGVDVSSGVEAAPGKKDSKLIKRFIEAVRAAEGVG